MIDNGVASKVSSSDPLAYVGGAGGKAEKPGDQGFSHTLDHVTHQENQQGKARSGSAGAEAAATDATVPDEAASAANSRPKPTIDIRFAMARSHAKSDDEKDAAENAEETASHATGTGKGKKGAHAAAGTGKLEKADKTEKSTEADVAATPATEAAPVVEENALGQMLSMLMGADEASQAPMSVDGGQENRKGKVAVSTGAAAVADALDFGVKSHIGADAGDMAGMGQKGEEDAGGKAFRLVRADGKGPSAAARADETGLRAPDERIASAKEGDPTVTLLESRRFIAPVSTSNATNISAAILGDSDWVSAMRAASDVSGADPSQSAAGKVVNTLKIQMNPLDLGLVTANLRLIGDTLSVHLTVENHAALRKLNEDNSDIVKALQSQGFAVDGVQVSVAPSRPDQGAGTQSDQQQPQGQTFAQNGQAGPQGQQRQGGGDSTAGFGNAMGLNGNDETAAAAAPRGSSDAGRSGDLYL